jgi:glucosamine-phosphate N-acetyltransferase
MEVTIRELCGPDVTPSFLETLGSLAEVQLSVPEALEIFRQRLRAGIRTYIAVTGGQIVGTATLLLEQKFIHGGGRVGHIEDVAVHRDFQKRGIGAALIRHMTRESRQFGCYKVILNCFEDRIPFYQSLGYRPHDVGLRLDLRQDAEACSSGSLVIPMAAIAP